MERKLKILLIDDDAHFLLLTRLSLEGNSLIESFSAFEGVENGLKYLEKTSGTTDFPNLIFIDYHLPVINGPQFAREFQSLYASRNEDTRLYVLSGYVSPTEKKKLRQIPCLNGIVSKPLSSENLEEIASIAPLRK